MSGQGSKDDPNNFTKIHDFVTDLIIEQQIISHFPETCISGRMPGGSQTKLPLIPFEVFVEKWNCSYSDWATGAHKNEPRSCNERVATALGSCEDPSHLGLLPRRMDFMKSRIWEGMAPISESRWRSLNFDSESNYTEAFQHLDLIVRIFSYLHEPKIQGNMREIFNLIHGEFEIFQTALNTVRAEQGESPLNITGLWEEFIQATFGYISRQARSYVFTHLKRLRKIHKDRIQATLLKGRVLSSTHGTVKIDHRAKERFNQLVDLTKRANVTLIIPITGFKNLHAFSSKPPTEEAANDKFAQLWAEWESRSEKALVGQVDRRARDREARGRFPYFMEELLVAYDREFALIDLQPEIGEPALLQPESWVADLKYRETKRFGYVAYRISYGESDEEWADVVRKFEKGIDVWDDIVGSANIRGKAVIEWIDGKKEGIPEGDINAARSHFSKFSKSSDFPSNLNERICLAFDPISANSFKHPELPAAVLALGGFRGHVLALEGDWESEDDNHGDVKGYYGQLRILDQLVWTDLYAMLASQCQFLNFMWKIAEDNPWEIYMGVKNMGCKKKRGN